MNAVLVPNMLNPERKDFKVTTKVAIMKPIIIKIILNWLAIVDAFCFSKISVITIRCVASTNAMELLLYYKHCIPL